MRTTHMGIYLPSRLVLSNPFRNETCTLHAARCIAVLRFQTTPSCIYFVQLPFVLTCANLIMPALLYLRAQNKVWLVAKKHSSWLRKRMHITSRSMCRKAIILPSTLTMSTWKSTQAYETFLGGELLSNRAVVRINKTITPCKYLYPALTPQPAFSKMICPFHPCECLTFWCRYCCVVRTKRLVCPGQLVSPSSLIRSNACHQLLVVCICIFGWGGATVGTSAASEPCRWQPHDAFQSSICACWTTSVSAPPTIRRARRASDDSPSNHFVVR